MDDSFATNIAPAPLLTWLQDQHRQERAPIHEMSVPIGLKEITKSGTNVPGKQADGFLGDYSMPKPAFRASMTSSGRLETANFAQILLTWLRTVFGASDRLLAMVVFD